MVSSDRLYMSVCVWGVGRLGSSSSLIAGPLNTF